MSSDPTTAQPIATRVAPWLSVTDATRAVEFYTLGFGAIEAERLEDEPGRVVVAQLSIDGAIFWVQQDEDLNPETLGCNRTRT